MSTYNVALTEDVKNFTITIDGDTRIFQIADGVGPQGATEWNELTGTLDILPFTTTNGGPQNQGELAWDSAEETLSLQLAHGTILQLGEETLYHVENVTGSNIADGTPVSYAGTVGNSGKMRVKPWNGATDDPLIFMGIATSDIETDDSGYVTHFGKVRGINTNAYTAGAVLYANPSGTGLTMTQPTTGQYVIAAVCVSSANNGTLFVRPTRYGGANWDAIGGKPSTFAPSAHTHPASAISDSTTTGRSLMTAANVSAARTTLELGNAALATTSTGGNGSADSGKVATYDVSGNLSAASFVLYYGGFTGGFLGTLLTANRGVYFSDASGVMALTASSTGIPDNLVVSSTKTTPVDADSVLMTDSEVAGTPAKRLSFANLWTWITTKLGGNLTIGGTKTWSGQQEATGQAATNGTSLMTRDLGDTRYKQNTYSELANDASPVVNSTTLVDTGNTITLAAGTWRVRIVDLLTANNATAGAKNAVSISQSCTAYGRYLFGDGGVGIPRIQTVTKQALTSIGGNNVGATAAWYEYDFVIVIPSSTTIKTQFANATAGTGNTTTAKAGSHIIATKMS